VIRFLDIFFYIGWQSALGVKWPAWRGMHHEECDRDDQQQCRYRSQYSQARETQHLDDSSVNESQVLTVVIIQHIVSPALDPLADHAFVHVEIQWNQRVIREHFTFGLT